MKRILNIISLSFVCFIAKAQTLPPTTGVGSVPSSKTDWYQGKYIQGMVIVENRDTLFTPRYSGTIVFWQHVGVDTAFWGWNGSSWNKVGSGGVDELSELLDVDVTGQQVGDVLSYNGTNYSFVPQGISPSATITWSVLAINTSAPVSPSSGDKYLVASPGTGFSPATVNQIAEWNGSAWVGSTAAVGDLLYDQATDINYKYTGSAWVALGKLDIHQGLDAYGVSLKIGSSDAQTVRLIYNGANRIVLGGTNGTTFSQLTGASTGIMGLSTTGVASNVQIGTGLLLSGGVLSSTVSGGITTADNGLTANTATNVRLGGTLIQNTTIDGSFTLLLSPSRTIISAADSISAIATNNVTVGSVGGTLSLLAPTVTAKSSALSTFGSATKTILHYETGVGDSVLMEFKATGAFLRGVTITTNSAYVPLQRNSSDGNLLPKLINLADGTNQVTGVLPIANGGTNNGSLAVTAGGVLYTDGSKVVNVGAGTSGQYLQSNGASAPTWVTASGAFWSLASGGTLTGANTITSNTVNGLIFNGAWTATADLDKYFVVTPSITGTATTSHIWEGLYVAPTFLSGANTQTSIAGVFDGTNLAANGKTGTLRWAMRVVANSNNSIHGINFVNSNSTNGALTNGAYIDIDNSGNFNIAPQNGTTTISSALVLTGTFQTNATASASGLVASSSGGLTTTQTELLFAGATTVASRMYSRASSSQVLAIGVSSSTMIIGTTQVQTAASGTHALLSSEVIKPPSVNVSGGATVTNTATLYVESGTVTGITPSNASYAFWVDAGAARLDGRLLTQKGADVASTNDLTLGADGNIFTITGTTQINAITTTGWESGARITLIFASTPTVKNNTAGGANTAVMLLAGGADFSATANDVLNLVYVSGTGFIETSRSVN